MKMTFGMRWCRRMEIEMIDNEKIAHDLALIASERYVTDRASEYAHQDGFKKMTNDLTECYC